MTRPMYPESDLTKIRGVRAQSSSLFRRPVAASSSCGEEVLDSAYAMEVLADSPISYYQCQDFGGILRDSTGAASLLNYFDDGYVARNRLDGPLTSACDKSVGGIYSFAMFRDDPLTTAINDFTMEMWAYPGEVATNSHLFYNGFINNNGYGIFLSASGGSLYMRGDRGGGSPLAISATAIDTLEWSHLVLQRDAGTWRYYINGASDGTYGTTAPTAPGSSSTHGGVWVSNSIPSGSNDWRVAHLAFYDTVLSSARIAAHYAAR